MDDTNPELTPMLAVPGLLTPGAVVVLAVMGKGMPYWSAIAAGSTGIAWTGAA